MFIWCYLHGTDESGFTCPHETRLLIKDMLDNGTPPPPRTRLRGDILGGVPRYRSPPARAPAAGPLQLIPPDETAKDMKADVPFQK